MRSSSQLYGFAVHGKNQVEVRWEGYQADSPEVPGEDMDLPADVSE